MIRFAKSLLKSLRKTETEKLAFAIKRHLKLAEVFVDETPQYKAIIVKYREDKLYFAEVEARRVVIGLDYFAAEPKGPNSGDYFFAKKDGSSIMVNIYDFDRKISPRARQI